ncbi:MAG: endopeptidase La, partial [Armatimonadetes bacterium]|nr:endopeptidase La [Armatimonadota bacterium]
MQDISDLPEIPEILPLLPIREPLYFPHNIFPLFVARDKSIRALEEAHSQDRFILLVAQRQVGIDDPTPEDMFEVGTAAEVIQVINLPDGTLRVMLEGQARVRV